MRNKVRVITLSLVFSFLLIGIIKAQETIPDRNAKVVEICRDPKSLLNNLQPPYQGNSMYPTLDQGQRPFLNIRNRNIKFFETMRFIAPPSTVALPFSSYTAQLDGGQQKKPYVLDASLRTPIAIGGPKMGLFSIHIIPSFDVRIFKDDNTYYYPRKPTGDESMPVRTQSNKIGVAVHWAHKNWLKLDNHYSRIPYLRFYAYHHSNGQDDSTFVKDSQNGNKMVVNTYNGNFSDHVAFEIGFGLWDSRQAKIQPKILLVNRESLRKAKRIIDSLEQTDPKSNALQTAKTNYDQMRSSYRLIRKIQSPNSYSSVRIATTQSFQSHWYAGLSLHPLSDEQNWVLPNQPDNAHMYPKVKLHTRLDLMSVPFLVEYVSNNGKWCLLEGGRPSETIRLSIDLKYTLDGNYYRGPTWEDLLKVKAFDFRRLNLDISIYRVLNNSSNVALFASTGIMGNDTYNIYFNDALWYIKFGLAFGFFNSKEASKVSTKKDIYYEK
jgi:hypothetical protein